MFNLSKTAKLFYTFRNVPLCANGLKSTSLGLSSHISLTDNNMMYFAGRPKEPKTGRTKEVVKSAALSDEKSTKLSKAEEEAEAKKKKMEAERARLQALKAPELPMKDTGYIS